MNPLNKFQDFGNELLDELDEIDEVSCALLLMVTAAVAAGFAAGWFLAKGN